MLYRRKLYESELAVEARLERYAKWEVADENNTDKIIDKKPDREKRTKEDLQKLVIETVDPDKIDFKTMYQDNLPPDVKTLEDFVEGFRDKESDKESIIRKIQSEMKAQLYHC